MYFDDYSTSFQSLYSPMYSLQTNYSANGAGPYGASIGMGMGFCDPLMSRVGVGQFGADQLVRNDQQLNNYYARPIATHKKKDDVPAILGILGTAMGTAAILLALRKGKYRKPPTVVNPPAPNVVNKIVPDVSKFGAQPYVAPKYLNPNTKGYNPLLAMTSKNGILNGINNIKTPSAPVQTTNLPVHVPNARMNEAIAKQQAAMNLPSSGRVFEMGGRTAATPNLPVHVPNARMNEAIAKQQAAMNLPSSGKVFEMGAVHTVPKANENLFVHNPELASRGNVVYTTHNPQTLAEGYSIGSNAKGADKLAALLAQMKA